MARLLVFLAAVLFSLQSLAAQDKKAAGDNRYFCYWMENVSGRFEWVPAEVGGMYRGEGYDRCLALDSCAGGLGESAGGCYKWARAATTLPVKWVHKDKK